MYSAEAQGESSFMITQHAKQCNTQRSFHPAGKCEPFTMTKTNKPLFRVYILLAKSKLWPILSEIDNNCDIARATAAKMH